jgi:hypothetical protein
VASVRTVHNGPYQTRLQARAPPVEQNPGRRLTGAGSAAQFRSVQVTLERTACKMSNPLLMARRPLRRTVGYGSRPGHRRVP